MTPQLFTTTDGITGRLKNPYEQYGDDMATAYMEFDGANPSYPIHSDNPPKGEFLGEVVNQLFSPTVGWVNEYKVKDLTKHIREKRVAVQPVPVKGEGKPKDASGYLQLANVYGKEQDGINPALLALWSNVENWYGDIGKKETGRDFLLRMQGLYNVSLKGRDTGSLVDSIGQVEKVIHNSAIDDAVKVLNQYIDKKDPSDIEKIINSTIKSAKNTINQLRK